MTTLGVNIMTAATSMASESDLLMAEHTGKVQDPADASATANGDVWGMPGRVSAISFTIRDFFYIVP